MASIGFLQGLLHGMSYVGGRIRMKLVMLVTIIVKTPTQ